MNRYPIIYKQKGGKEFDYLLYRFLNQFIMNKFLTLNIVNSFSDGFTYTAENTMKLVRSLRDNGVSEENIREINSFFELIRLKSFAGVNNTLIDKDKEDYTSLVPSITILPLENILTSIPDLKPISNYIEYIFKIREGNFDKDKNTYLLNEFYNSSLFLDADFQKQLKKYNDQGKNMKRLDKSISSNNKNLFTELSNLKPIVSTINETGCNIYNIIFKGDDIEKFKNFYENEFLPISESKPVIDVFLTNTPFERDQEFLISSFRIISDITFSPGLTELKINVSSSNLNEFVNQDHLVYFGLNGPKINSCISAIIRATNDLDILKRVNLISEFPLLARNITISDNQVNYFNLNDKYLFYVNESGKLGNISGDQFEDNAMFLSVLNICRINPDIDMKNIRILSGVHVYDLVNKEIGEIDIVILNNDNQIEAIGELKSYIDGVQKAYQQFNTLKTELLKPNIKFTINKSDYLNFELSAKFESQLQSPDPPELLSRLQIFLFNSSLYDLDIHNDVNKLIKEVFKMNMVKIHGNNFILNPSNTQLKYDNLSDWVNTNLLNSGQKLTSRQIISKYIGTNNLTIFSKIENLPPVTSIL